MSPPADTLTVAQAGALTTEAAGATVIIKWEVGGTWAESRFLMNGTRSVTINGNVFGYTGGETTDRKSTRLNSSH